MDGRAENLFAGLQNAAAVLALVGEAEDAHLDCKEWPAKEDDAQKMLAKAACGLTNADGGVLVVGMKAESRPKDEPDVVTAAAPPHGYESRQSSNTWADQQSSRARNSGN